MAVEPVNIVYDMSVQRMTDPGNCVTRMTFYKPEEKPLEFDLLRLVGLQLAYSVMILECRFVIDSSE
jgi:hypothetical protein